MSHRNKICFTQQIKDALDARLAIGQSKYTDKRERTADGRRVSDEKIYSWNTYRAYMQHANYFTDWIEKYHPECKTLARARQYVDTWLCSRVCDGLSAYTVKLDAAALGKVYGCSTKDFDIITPPRLRNEIVRSRGEKVRDKHFSEKNNAALISFCRCCGLRRSELEKLRGDDLIQNSDGSYSIRVISGKGGRDRCAPVIGSPDEVRAVVDRMRAAGNNKAWGRVHNAADIHSYRRDYALRVYQLYARPVGSLQGQVMPDPDKAGRVVSAVYRSRDKKKREYDRAALLQCSRALGHNRVDVVARHYLD